MYFILCIIVKITLKLLKVILDKLFWTIAIFIMVILIEKSSRDKNKPNFTIIMISFAKQLKKTRETRNWGIIKTGFYKILNRGKWKYIILNIGNKQDIKTEQLSPLWYTPWQYFVSQNYCQQNKTIFVDTIAKRGVFGAHTWVTWESDKKIKKP